MTMIERKNSRLKAPWWAAWKHNMRENLLYRGYTFVDKGQRFETDAPIEVARQIADAMPTGENWKAYVESLDLQLEKT